MNEPFVERDSSPNRRVPRGRSTGSPSRPVAGALPAPVGVAGLGAWTSRQWTLRLLRNMAVLDWIVVAYFVLLLFALVFGSGPNRGPNIQRVVADLTLVATGLILARGEIIPRGTLASSLVYRAATFGTVTISYFQLQQLLPAVTSRSMDDAIFALDMRLFGVEPALAWDRFVTPQTTEWFAFFYFSYFVLLTVHAIPCLTVGDGKMNARFALGMYMCFCVAHVFYTIVPGYGPYAYLVGRFGHALEGRVFWPLVVRTVVENGALKDIFPSLHTAVPTYCTVFALLHRDRAPFRYTWPVLLFWSSQIVIATMFLRWHYLIDIVAGLVLAVSAAFLARRIDLWERRRREALGLPPVFGPLVPKPASGSLNA